MEIGVSIGPRPGEVENVPEKYDFVELAIGEHEIAPREINLEKLGKELEKKGFDLVVHLPLRQPFATGIDELNSANLEYLERLIMEMEKTVEIRKAVIHANMRDRESEVEKENMKKQVTELQRISRKHGVTTCVENVGLFEGLELFELGEMLEELGAKMCFDTGHAFAETGQEQMEQFLEEYSHLISHLHVQDTRGNEDMHIPVGSGEIDFEELAGAIGEFQGTTCLEIYTDDMDYFELSREKFLRYFKK